MKAKQSGSSGSNRRRLILSPHHYIGTRSTDTTFSVFGCRIIRKQSYAVDNSHSHDADSVERSMHERQRKGDAYPRA